MPQSKRSRAAGAVLTTAIVGLTLATAYIHSTLGGLLFTLNALGYLGLAIDITDRVAAEQQVERQRRFYESLLGELPLPLAVFDRDGRVVYVNAALVPRPATREALLGQTMPERMTRQLGIAGDGCERLREVIDTGRRQQWDERRTGPDGRQLCTAPKP